MENEDKYLIKFDPRKTAEYNAQYEKAGLKGFRLPIYTEDECKAIDRINGIKRDEKKGGH